MSASALGGALKARTIRGTALTVVSFGGANIVRLISNLILTRLLFPEVFGLMALVTVFLIGLQMFSDLGLNASIIQNKRSHEPEFLNTAWTVQILRGVLLWLITCAMAAPVASFYDQPLLTQVLPVAGLSALILGFQSTSVATVNRDMLLGRLTALELGTQIFGIVVMIALAAIWQSVWPLVIGTLLTNLAKTVLSHLVLPGLRNRLHWDPSAFSNLFHFGKWLFLSSICGFVVAQSDRVLMGKFFSLTELAVYNIALTLAGLSYMLTQSITHRIMFPLYRNAPPSESAKNQASVFKTRRAITGGLFIPCLIFALVGIPLIEVLYDPRYILAGPILVGLSLSFLPLIMTESYLSVLLAEGRSREFAFVMMIKAVVRIGCLYLGMIYFGLPGVIVAPFIAEWITYPLTVYFARSSDAWDPGHDLLYAGVMVAAIALVAWTSPEAVAFMLSQVTVE